MLFSVSVSALLVLGLFLVGACAPWATPTPVQPPATAPRAAPATPDWQVESDKTLSEARKEGRVVIYGSSAAYLSQLLSEGFQKAYGPRLEMISGGGSVIATKILTERRAGIYLVDLVIGGTSTPIRELKTKGALDNLELALILPELTQPEEIRKVWWGGQLDWVDKDHTVITFLAYVSLPLIINIDLVKPEEIKSYRDLLDTKSKDKIQMLDPTQPGIGQNWFFSVATQIMGWNYLRELVKQKPFITRDQRLMIEWVARGKSFSAGDLAGRAVN